MPPFLEHQCFYSFHDKSFFPGAKAILTRCVLLICDFMGFVFVFSQL